jgi:ribonuclease-3
MIGSSGPDHKKEFEIAIVLDEKTIATARGKSKKDAQQKAAKIALERLKG